MDRLLRGLGSSTGHSPEKRHTELVGWAREKAGSGWPGGGCLRDACLDLRPAIPAGVYLPRIFFMWSLGVVPQPMTNGSAQTQVSTCLLEGALMAGVAGQHPRLAQFRGTCWSDQEGSGVRGHTPGMPAFLGSRL